MSYAMRHGVRQVELAERIGYEQSNISALKAGAKGPPMPEFVDRQRSALDLTDEGASK
jgi:predicted transcriptional regulator